jgi:hypothetical protein
VNVNGVNSGEILRVSRPKKTILIQAEGEILLKEQRLDDEADCANKSR